MSLLAAWMLMSDMFDELNLEISDFISKKSTSISGSSDFTLADECLLEGVLSRFWQAWGSFCRSTICLSCLGTIDGNGTSIIAHADALSEEHVSGAAIAAKRKRTPIWGPTNSVLRLEVTWGDPDVLAKILPAMSVPRANQLLAALSQAHGNVKAIQIIRNAAAHMHTQNLSEVAALSSRFIAYKITHPVQALFWVEPTSGDYLFRHALEDLRDNALIAIS